MCMCIQELWPINWVVFIDDYKDLDFESLYKVIIRDDFFLWMFWMFLYFVVVVIVVSVIILISSKETDYYYTTTTTTVIVCWMDCPINLFFFFFLSSYIPTLLPPILKLQNTIHTVNIESLLCLHVDEGQGWWKEEERNDRSIMDILTVLYYSNTSSIIGHRKGQ